MLKHFLSKFPRKSPKSEAASDSGEEISSGNPIQRASGGNSGSKRASSSAVFPATAAAGIEPLLSFKEVSASDKPNLFISKMNLCCAIFDFGDQSKNVAEKDIKSRTLLELADFVSTSAAKFSDQAIAASCKMFAANLFRVFPPSYRSKSAGENEEDEPKFDPAWPHLQIIYDLLLKFIASNSLDAKLAKKHVDHGFILQLLDLFDSEDPRERDSLKTILHRIYGKFMVHRPFIRKSAANIFFRFIFETEKHNGISELLEVLGSVISGFAAPLKEEHKMFLKRALIPLHKAKSLGGFLQQLTFCVVQFIDKDERMASVVIQGLLKYWPATSSQKEVMFLGELEEILETTTAAEFQKVMVPLFRRIGSCFNSSHFQVAERALFLWNSDRIGNLVAEHREVILPVILPALERNARGHWSNSVLNASLNVRKMFSDMDEELFVSCRRRHQEEEAQRAAAEELRRENWSRLEAAAAAKLRPASGYSAAVLVNCPAAPPPLFG